MILSACNTAAGDAANAEALSGLARAFIYAQARALLVSHWAVDSNATVKLITSAMREIARDRKTVGRAEALRRAMLALIDKGDAARRIPPTGRRSSSSAKARSSIDRFEASLCENTGSWQRGLLNGGHHAALRPRR